MITAQPHNISAFISVPSQEKQSNKIMHSYYLSWEDALWDIIEHKQIPKGSIAFVPTFWCNDVKLNMHRHGIVCHTYPMNASFQTPIDDLRKAIRTFNPRIIIVFLAVGIRNNLLTTQTEWMNDLTSEQIVIEDSVHSIVNPSDVVIPRNNYFVIDSWRKVMPLQGCSLYGNINSLPPKIKQQRELLYTARVYFWWFAMQAVLTLQSKSQSIVARVLGQLAEWCMERGYDVIGDSAKGATAQSFFIRLHDRLNYTYIKGVKRKQVEIYENKLNKTIETDTRLFSIHIPPCDTSELRGYPIGLKLENAHVILNMLRTKGLCVRFELNDSIWSTDKKVIFLPLGPHLSLENIELICAYFMDALLQCTNDRSYS